MYPIKHAHISEENSSLKKTNYVLVLTSVSLLETFRREASQPGTRHTNLALLSVAGKIKVWSTVTMNERDPDEACTT